jgi:peptidoglycan/LPS O-acetylase OafA/YrhL
MTGPSVGSRRVNFPNLDGLRFFAFLTVFLHHGFDPLAHVMDGTALERPVHVLFRSAWAGVSFFFVLSGFLITYLILTEIETTGTLDVISFYIRRVLRIWPLYYAVVIFAIVLYPVIKGFAGVSTNVEYGKAWYYFAFLGNFDVIHLGADRGAGSTNITWSVAIEEQFYLVWPLLLRVFSRRLHAYVLCVIVGASFLFRLAHADSSMVLYFHTMAVISDMAIGGLAAYLSINSEQFRRTFRDAKRRWLVATYVLGLILLIWGDAVFVGSVGIASGRIVFALFFAFVVLEQNFSERSFGKAGNLKMISRLGIYTYGLYLLHPIVITLLQGALRYVRHEPSTIPGELAFGVVAFVGTIVVGYLSYTYFERPFLLLKSRFERISTVPHPVATAVQEAYGR